MTNFEIKCNEYRGNKRMIEELTAIKDGIKADIIEMMGGQEAVIRGAAKVTYKSVDIRRFDSKVFKEIHPDLYSEYMTQFSYRRFIIE